MKKPETIALHISHIGAGGDGVGTHNGKPVYVPKTAPGDVVTARLESENADGFQARLLKIDAPSPERIDPPCPYFQRCGGCALQHVNDDFYRSWKIEKVTSALSRAGIETARMEEPVFLRAATRRRTTMAALKNGDTIVFGYNEIRSHTILDIKLCLILEPRLDEKMQSLRPYLPRLLPDKKPVDIMIQHADGKYDMVLTGLKPPFSLEQLEVMGELAETLDIARISTREKDFSSPEIVFTRKPVVKIFGGLSVGLPPGAFLQASVPGEDALVKIVTGYAQNSRKIADLFCGSGTFSGALLETGVHAVDGDEDAISALQKTKHKNLTTARRNLFKDPLNTKELTGFDAVIFDPPRAGAKAQVENLAYAKLGKIIAVSCNPASFARDAKALQEGGYALKSLSIVDQFVWSAHVEIAALFAQD